MPETKNLYDVLGVKSEATTKEIKTAYRALSKQHHPDHGGSAEVFARITAAADILTDPTKRAAYDFELKHPRTPPQRPAEPKAQARPTATSTSTSAPPPEAPKIIVACPHCGQKNRVIDLPAIQAAKCGSCKQTFPIEREEPDSYGKLFDDVLSALRKNAFGEYITRAEEAVKRVKDLADDILGRDDKQREADRASGDPMRRADARMKDFDDYLKKL